MKTHREENNPQTIRKERGVRIEGADYYNKESMNNTSTSPACKNESHLHQYYQVGKVYAFTVGTCISTQKADGTQHTTYFVKDKRGEKHSFSCDCICYKYNQVIFLRIKEICYNKLKFENSIINRLDEIFIKGEEYEFEVISYINNRFVVCDTQIGKNHYLPANNNQLYKKREKVRLKVQGFDDKGHLLLEDKNPPTPPEVFKNSLQILAESMAETQKNVLPASHKTPKHPKPVLQQKNQSILYDTPKVAPSIAIPRENKKVLVEDLGYKTQQKTAKSVPRPAEPKPIYTRSIKQPQAAPQLVQQSKTQPKQQTTLQPKPQTNKAHVLLPFMAWMEEVPGMEKTKDYTLCTGHVKEVKNTGLPVYKYQEVCKAEPAKEPIQIKPWYIRLWKLINCYFRKR